MTLELPGLPYAVYALAPVISERTVAVHHGRHHAGYLKALGKLLGERGHAGVQLEEIVKTAEDASILANAAQAWNHQFYWKCMSPAGGGEPPPEVASELQASFGSVGSFRRLFSDDAKNHFGSGWAWLVWNHGSLAVVTTHDAGCPLRDGQRPLLACDLWEHAYYLDYLNERSRYIDAWWDIVDWLFVAENLRRAGLEGDAAC
jgi:Fe-Mn family superoxide dismutase